jgi:hypothetical protein
MSVCNSAPLFWISPIHTTCFVSDQVCKMNKEKSWFLIHKTKVSKNEHKAYFSKTNMEQNSNLNIKKHMEQEYIYIYKNPLETQGYLYRRLYMPDLNCVNDGGLQIYSITKICWHTEEASYFIRCKRTVKACEVFTAVILKSIMIWDVFPHIPTKVNWHFGRTYCLHLQCWRVSQTINQWEVGTKQVLLAADDGSDMFLQNVGWHPRRQYSFSSCTQNKLTLG